MDNMKMVDKLLQDEVVQFISVRHHVTPKEILDCFTMQAGDSCRISDQHAVELEENEIQIILDLIRMYH